MRLEEIQNEVAKEWNEAFDYRALRNGVQVGNIKMIHLDKVNTEVCKRYATECCKATLEKASKNKSSITDESNITLV